VVAASNGEDNNKLGNTLSPFVSQVSAILEGVKKAEAAKGGKKLTAAEKKVQVAKAQDTMTKLGEAMANRGAELLKESRSDKTNLLMGVLLSRKDQSMEEQYKVLEDGEFKFLDVVKFVEQSKDMDTRPLVEQCAEYLDAPQKYKILSLSKEEKAEKDASDAKAEQFEKDHEAETVVEKQIKDVKAQSKEEVKAQAEQALKAAVEEKQELLEKLEEKKAELQQQEAGLQQLAAAKKASNSKSKKSAQKPMATMLLQVAFYAHRDCPYCKAQCFEKCHDAGKPYMGCMTECAAVGN